MVFVLISFGRFESAASNTLSVPDTFLVFSPLILSIHFQLDYKVLHQTLNPCKMCNFEELCCFSSLALAVLLYVATISDHVCPVIHASFRLSK